ncbi:hypothetical protein B0H16DRAFT_101729 [Mycena metata]|uniref:Uncharacterized protein n=1 Tax=Mycena metata TaxID=1033252 RepID=A0AAD7IB53_9AGAR|nr:hypothetical protein B0H16DRAFT_101729 [Mycena metata]
MQERVREWRTCIWCDLLATCCIKPQGICKISDSERNDSLAAVIAVGDNFCFLKMVKAHKPAEEDTACAAGHQAAGIPFLALTLDIGKNILDELFRSPISPFSSASDPTRVLALPARRLSPSRYSNYDGGRSIRDAGTTGVSMWQPSMTRSLDQLSLSPLPFSQFSCGTRVRILAEYALLTCEQVLILPF